MKKMRVAIIGQGRSGRDIHGAFFRSEANTLVDVVAIVDELDYRRERAAEEFGCPVYEKYQDLFGRDDIDLVINASYSNLHYPIAKDLLNHGFNVLCEKPLARTTYECMDLIHTAKANGKIVTAFHQTLCTPLQKKLHEIMDSGILGDIMQISLKYSSFGRRWDWQTLQFRCAGSVYNSGPHPIGQALDLIGWDKNTRVAYSSLKKALTLGDAEDYGKIILDTPGKPTIDIEIIAADAFAGDFNFKLFGTKGTLVATNTSYRMKFLNMEDLPKQDLIFGSMRREDGTPSYCAESLPIQEKTENLAGTAFDAAVKTFYDQLYDAIILGKELEITPEKASMVVGVIETCHAQNPLPVLYGEECR